jgi:hypothetical protein
VEKQQLKTIYLDVERRSPEWVSQNGNQTRAIVCHGGDPDLRYFWWTAMCFSCQREEEGELEREEVGGL